MSIASLVHLVLHQSESLVHCSLLQITRKLTQLLYKRTKTCWWWKRTAEQVFLNNLYLDTESCSEAIFTLYRVAFAPARKSNRTGLCSYIRTVILVQFLLRSEAAPRRSLKWRGTYRIGVHTISDSFFMAA